MAMFYQFVKKSGNAKIGSMACTNSTKKTCPPACPLRWKGCYAEAGFHTRLNWDKLTAGERGGTWEELMAHIAAIPSGEIWRHNVSGDLPPIAENEISNCAVNDLITANRGKRGFTYTHYPMDRTNARIVRQANNSGFTINASANTLAQAADYHRRGLPTVTLVSDSQNGDQWRKLERGKMTVVQCPAEYREDVTCKSCGLCARSKRDVVVGFTVHGTQKKTADLIAIG